MKPTTACSRGLEYSRATLDEIRRRLAGLSLRDRIVLVCGSYARREASENSDMDFFMVKAARMLPGGCLANGPASFAATS